MGRGSRWNHHDAARRSRWLAAIFVAYAAAFAALWPMLGLGAGLLGAVPSGLAGWWLGVAGGVAALGLSLAIQTAGALLVGGVDAIASWPWSVLLLSLAAQSGVAIGFGLLHRRRAAAFAEREAIASALEESDERFRILAEEALLGVYIIRDGVFAYVNPRFANVFGYEPADLVGRATPDDLTVPEDRELVRDRLAHRLERGGTVAHYRFRGRREDGSTVPVEVSGRVVRMEGRPAVLGTLRDRSHEVRTEQELSLRLTALEAAPTGIVITDPSGVIEWANPHAAQLTGYAPDELRGRHTRVLKSGRQDDAFYQTLWHEVAAGRPWSGEIVNRRKDGSEYVEKMTITPVRDGDGSIAHFVAAKVDVTETRRAERDIRRLNASLRDQLERISALRAIDQAIVRALDLDDALQVLLGAARSSLGASAVAVLLANDPADTYAVRGAIGFRARVAAHARGDGPGIVGAAVRTERPQLVRGTDEVRGALAASGLKALLEADLEAIAAAPMLARGLVRGVMIAGRHGDAAGDDDWLDYFGSLAVQGGIMVDSADLVGRLRASNERLEAAYDATIEGWARALDLRDHETEGHSRRVTELSLRLARALGYPEDRLDHLRRGALLHDIGKMGVPDAILQKPGKLTPEEWAIMQRHTTLARDLLEPIAFLHPALDVPYAHHERWDGRGYPQGLAGDAIPLAARIFAVADVYDALTSDRPYRDAWTHERTIDHIREGAGTHFDPAVVAAVLAMMDEGSRPSP